LKKVVISAAAEPPNPRWPRAAGGSVPKPPRCNYRLLSQHFVKIRF